MAVWQTNNIAASADRCRKEEETMNRSSRTVKLVEMALLVAIILILAFTPLGYIKTLGLEITLIVVPVTIGAIILGPLGGAVLGAVFGITSFIQCFGMSPFGAVLLGINPFGTFVVCVVSRILMGWLTGLIYKGLSKFPKMKNWKILIARSNLKYLFLHVNTGNLFLQLRLHTVTGRRIKSIPFCHCLCRCQRTG